jgi:hypothetical protein
MGLDLAEFTFAIEDAFGLYVPDADAVQILTPGQLVEYLQVRTPVGARPPCLDQRAFYLIRRAGMQVLGRPREAFNPSAPWRSLLHPSHHARQWKLLGDTAGLKPWPRLKPLLTFCPTTQTVGETATMLATSATASLLRPTEGWDRPAIERVVRRLMAEQLGVLRFAWADHFVKDFGCN